MPCCEFAPEKDDLPGLIRHMKGSHPEMTEEIQTLSEEMAGYVRERWKDTFGGPLQVDFVCMNPAKMELLMATMEISDLVPMSYGMMPAIGPNRFRVMIEI